MSEKRGVLFVCLANICRSPIAEAVFNHVVKERNLTDKWFSDSAGTGGWVGSKPDKRAASILKRHSVQYNHRARQLCEEDFHKFDYIFGMDYGIINDINEEKPPNSKAIVQLLGKYDPQMEMIIKDPYFETEDECYSIIYQQCLRCCNAFLDQLK